MFLLATGKINPEDNMKNILMQVWENEQIQILETGFQKHRSESFVSRSISGLGERNLFFLQAFLSVATAAHDYTPTGPDEPLEDDDEEGGGGGGGGGGPGNGLSCDFAVRQVHHEVSDKFGTKFRGK